MVITNVFNPCGITCEPQKEPVYNVKELTKSVKIKREEVTKEIKKSALKNTKFTPEEDEFLATGLKKYGKKNWAAILKDKELNFHGSRTRDSLRMRADSATFKRTFHGKREILDTL